MLFVPVARRMAFEAAQVARWNQFRAISSTTARLAQATSAAPVVVKKGGLGDLYGFLAGCTLAGGASYFYFLEEYRLANELLTEDVDALRASVLRIEQYVRGVEDKLADGSVIVKKK
ncbi:hypothetical protein BGX38DRAFT_1166868 [Terfezia claveryi]|nr:hypothetical protein BGX38DRAFT_1166868 [Terfezia claveryi]